MSRSFTRFDPRAADAKIWRTAENGKKYQLDDETGEILKGNVGQKPKGEPYQSRQLESTSPDKARFDTLVQKHGSNHKKAAREYFRERLQGRHVEAWTPVGPIEAVFTGDSWTELKKDMAKDPIKAALVPYLPDIIATGEYASEPPTGRHPDVKRFHTYRKTIQTDAGPKEVIVDVAERPEHKPSQPRHQVYSFTREGTHAYTYRKQKEAASLPGPPGQNRGGQGTPTQDSNAVVDEKISPQFEVVNLRVSPGAFGTFTGPFAGLNRINVGDAEGRAWA